MHIEIEQMPELRVATVRHVGPYQTIRQAFERLSAVTGNAGLSEDRDTLLLAIYHDDPETTPVEKLRSDAGIVVPSSAALPKELGEERIPAGRYARAEHIGPYETLADTWSRFKHDWLPASGHPPGRGPSFEVYRNTPMTTPKEKLVTHLYIAVA